MTEPDKSNQNFLVKYFSPLELFGWGLCIISMIVIVTSQDIYPFMLPYAWAGAICGAGLIGWGAGRKHRRK